VAAAAARGDKSYRRDSKRPRQMATVLFARPHPPAPSEYDPRSPFEAAGLSRANSLYPIVKTEMLAYF
jgi:hypothetical protein